MIIDGVAQIINETSTGVVYSVYKTTAELFNSTLVNIIFVLISCLWVWNKIGREWSKEDFYKAGSWVIMFVCIKVIFTNFSNYQEFLELIHLPVGWCFIMQ